jgi:hypothetical protein
MIGMKGFINRAGRCRTLQFYKMRETGLILAIFLK